NGSARMGTSYVLSTARATARKAGKRALLQSFRFALSRAPDRAVVTVNCGTAGRRPRNMLHKTAFCVSYQAGERPMARSGGRSCADELFFERGDTTSGQSSIECASESRVRQFRKSGGGTSPRAATYSRSDGTHE